MKNTKFTKMFTLVSAFMLLMGSFNASRSYLPFEDEGEGGQDVSKVPDPQEGYTRYEAEDAVIEGCVKKGRGAWDETRTDLDDWEKLESSDYGVYSGCGFVGKIDNAWSKVTFTVNVSEKGSYPIYVGYAIGSTGNAQLELVINGDSFATWTFKQKNGWGSFDTTIPFFNTINLKSGTNSIQFVHKNQYVELDYIDIGPCQGEEIDPSINDSDIAKIPEGYTRYEAENGAVNEGNIYRVISSNSGTGFVGELDTNGRSSITWTVNAAAKGEYKVRIAYAIGSTGEFGDASFKINRDGVMYTIVSMNVKNGWGIFDIDAIAEATLSLNQGENTVSLVKTGNYAQIDFMDISNEPIGEFKEQGFTLDYPNQKEGYTRYEAEEQMVYLCESKGIGYYVNMGHYSGKGFVGSLDNDYQYVEFNFNVAEDGEYAIRVAYACMEVGASLKLYSGSHGRNQQVYFDKEITATVASDWGEFTSETIIETTVSIKAGSRAFVLVKGGNIKAEIDYIDLGAKVGEYKQGEKDEYFDRDNY